GAALTAAADAILSLSLEGQIGTFALASALACAAGYFVYRHFSRRHHRETPLNERSRAMLGARGTVCEPLVGGEGKVAARRGGGGGGGGGGGRGPGWGSPKCREQGWWLTPPPGPGEGASRACLVRHRRRARPWRASRPIRGRRVPAARARPPPPRKLRAARAA